MKKILITTILICSATNTFANTNGTSHGILFGLGLANIDQDVADKTAVDESALSIRIGWEYRRSDYIFGAGISGLVYDDSAEFSERVIDQFGNIDTADSTANAFNFYVEGGYEYALTPYLYADFLGGYEKVLSSSRSISNCEDCFDIDIDIDAGLYVNPRLTVILDSTVFFSLGYQHYLGGDIDNNIMLSIGIGARNH